MIGEWSQPQELHESGEAREAQIDELVRRFSYAGTEAGQIILAPTRTLRDIVHLSDATDSGHDVQFNPGITIVKVSPLRDEAFVARVARMPRRHGDGLLRTYTIASLFTEKPQVTGVGRENFVHGNMFDLPLQPGEYAKVHNAKFTGMITASPQHDDIIRSGDMGLERWREFSAAYKAAATVDHYLYSQGDAPA